MINSKTAALIFANSRDILLGELTERRSMASVPFGARYRIIDFSLSNLVNAGISNIGIITKSNYKSLMDHLGSGIFWDLDRKQGGIHLLAPYSSNFARRYEGVVEGLYGARDFIERCGADNIIICAGDLVANVDIDAAIAFHKKNEADVTFVCAEGTSPEKHTETPIVEFDSNNRVEKMSFSASSKENVIFGSGITIINVDLLKTLVRFGYENNIKNLNSDILAHKITSLKMFAFIHNGYISVVDGIKKYFDSNMQLLENSTRNDLFNVQRPIMTKTRDDMPTRYGINADVKGSLIADGCIIEGSVKNSIIFRGVHIGKGAVIENSVIMQEAVIEDTASLKYVIADKNAVVCEGMRLEGTSAKPFIIEKNARV